ncbi:MAG: DJ-1/PfpI family protein [Candidatus Omnitrophica bacterium]|nr:DJ-1/PfpI family protein [Candidatus Omnitrophota bacterium]
MSKKNALLILADGFEDAEGIGTLDVLRRAGIDVKLAGLLNKQVTSARGVKITTDLKLSEAGEDFDAVILPGGSVGAENLSKSLDVRNLIKKMFAKGKIVAAICASPAIVLASTGVLEGKKATCYPGLEKFFPSGVNFSDEDVVVDGNLVTSRGPATALKFGLKLVELLAGKDAVGNVKDAMLI